MKKLQAVQDEDPYSGGENSPGTRTPLITISDTELDDHHPGPVIATSGVPIPPSGAAEGPRSGVGSDDPPRSL